VEALTYANRAGQAARGTPPVAFAAAFAYAAADRDDTGPLPASRDTGRRDVATSVSRIGHRRPAARSARRPPVYGPAMFIVITWSAYTKCLRSVRWHAAQRTRRTPQTIRTVVRPTAARTRPRCDNPWRATRLNLDFDPAPQRLNRGDTSAVPAPGSLDTALGRIRRPHTSAMPADHRPLALPESLARGILSAEPPHGLPPSRVSSSRRTVYVTAWLGVTAFYGSNASRRRDIADQTVSTTSETSMSSRNGRVRQTPARASPAGYESVRLTVARVCAVTDLGCRREVAAALLLTSRHARPA
jgi:hypothetical protein